MDTPKIADTRPVVTELSAGTYWWCACGHSATQPWCDGAHKGGCFSPMEVTIVEEKRYALCTCKQTASPPFCDGAHKRCVV